MNMDYLENYYENHKVALFDSEQEIKTFEEFKEYLYSTILSNVQYDFGIDIDIDKLLNLNEKAIKQDIEEEIEK